ncbi:hypothetical protein P4S83_01765 [Aneurinibacillus thermoaerophilus]|uniref:hypothetical protein n=1 Tax=Aneurinibacillus thermoaerophilus TaxID=143495 RepID=UPI002E1A7562|nr:hypothetical protein [Aneurinibacillus thermoaerophilus]
MYGARPGGVSPHQYGLQVTVLVPTATEAAPINTGDNLKFVNTGAYHAAPCADGDAIQLKALHPVKDGKTPLGCQLYGFSRIDKFTYTGADLVIGDSIVAAGKGAVKKADAANGTVVLFVDTAKKIVEVAMP